MNDGTHRDTVDASASIADATVKLLKVRDRTAGAVELIRLARCSFLYTDPDMAGSGQFSDNDGQQTVMDCIVILRNAGDQRVVFCKA